MTLVRQKVTKSSVNYRVTGGVKRCADCAMYDARHSECDLVRGIIRPEYVCDRWVIRRVSKGKSGGNKGR